MRETIIKCDCCGKEMESAKLSVAMFPYKTLFEYCEKCAVPVRNAILESVEKTRGESKK